MNQQIITIDLPVRFAGPDFAYKDQRNAALVIGREISSNPALLAVEFWTTILPDQWDFVPGLPRLVGGDAAGDVSYVPGREAPPGLMDYLLSGPSSDIVPFDFSAGEEPTGRNNLIGRDWILEYPFPSSTSAILQLHQWSEDPRLEEKLVESLKGQITATLATDGTAHANLQALDTFRRDLGRILSFLSHGLEIETHFPGARLEFALRPFSR